MIERMGRLGLALGVLGGIIILAVLLSPRTWLPQRAEPTPPTPQAALLAESAMQAVVEGDLPQARRNIEEALAERSQHAPALLLQVCMALEAGDFQSARS